MHCYTTSSRTLPARLFMLSFLTACAGLAYATEVTLRHRGLTLNANMETAAGKTMADGVVLITHGSLAHNGMETVMSLQKLLKDKGHNTLAINLSLGLDNRHGMYDCKVIHRHRNTDAVAEISAWVGWLKGQGAKQVAVLGHSRGGAQTALYGAKYRDDVVNAVVLLAPATQENNGADRYQQLFQQSQRALVARAQKLTKTGKGSTVLKRVGILTCTDASVTAESFLSYYDPNAPVDSPTLIQKIGAPVLVVVAGNDEIVIGLENKVAPLVDGQQIQMKVINGADHFFRDLNMDEAVEAIDTFLKAQDKRA